MSGDAKHYDPRHSVERRYGGGTNEMGIESRCLDEYGKMSIESRETKRKKKRNVNDKPSSKVQITTNTERRFSVEMSSVHENLNAHEEFRRFRRLLCSRWQIV